MIRYRKLNEMDEEDVVYIPDNPAKFGIYDVVKYAGHEWYVINIDDDFNVTLLAKNNDFGTCAFSYDESNIYRDSEIREYLLDTVLYELKSKGANPLYQPLNDVKCKDKVWLLSVDEAKDLPKEIRDFKNWWWLRSPGHDSGVAAYVTNNGRVIDIGNFVADDDLDVRPAIVIEGVELL